MSQYARRIKARSGLEGCEQLLSDQRVMLASVELELSTPALLYDAMTK
jgi:hypothetical protein